MDRGSILIFDGYCRLCSNAVDFIVRRDPEGRFRFAAAQSEAGKALLSRYGLSERGPDTQVLIEDGIAHTDSTAALRIARRLGGVWQLFYVFILVPRFLRDVVYRFIARNRYRWFGKTDTCRVPTPELKARFLT